MHCPVPPLRPINHSTRHRHFSSRHAQAESGHGRQDLPGSSSGHARRGGARRLPWRRQDPATAAAEGPDQGEDPEGHRHLRRRYRCRPREERPRWHPVRQVTNESEVEAKATTGLCCYTGAHFSARSRGPPLAVVCVSISVVDGSSLAYFMAQVRWFIHSLLVFSGSSCSVF
jgi:hypothetical protein